MDENPKAIKKKKEKFYPEAVVQPRERGAAIAALRADEVEDQIISAIDFQNSFNQALPILKKLHDKKISIKKAMELAGPLAVGEFFKLALGTATSERVKADLLKHMLAIAGVQPSQRIEVARVDADTPREALIAIIEGAAKEVKDLGVELVEDVEVEPSPKD